MGIGEIGLELGAEGGDFGRGEAGGEEAVEALGGGGSIGSAGAPTGGVVAGYRGSAGAPLRMSALILRFQGGLGGLGENGFRGELGGSERIA